MPPRIMPSLLPYIYIVTGLRIRVMLMSRATTIPRFFNLYNPSALAFILGTAVNAAAPGKGTIAMLCDSDADCAKGLKCLGVSETCTIGGFKETIGVQLWAPSLAACSGGTGGREVDWRRRRWM
ncbi:hypothetical protein A0H81_07294 [Grifola frondosa]|uniref:Uncharacterized protein n=1 Tax=Grifola frondosa TaxID=5627 RepID=A0A1C7MER4_GRIFR|nr:hypothetical protein A0H81_07294 [Grifola frondosa]